MFDLIISIFQPSFLIKLVAIIFSIMVLILSLAVAKQSSDMDTTVSLGSSGGIVKIASYFMVFLALVLLLTAIVIL